MDAVFQTGYPYYYRSLRKNGHTHFKLGNNYINRYSLNVQVNKLIK